MGLMREVENNKGFRTALVDLEVCIKRMDACGVSKMLLSWDPPGVQPYLPNDAVPLARDFNDSLVEIVRRYPERFAGLGTVTPQDAVAASREIERIMGPLGLSGIMISSHTGASTWTNHSLRRCWTLPKRTTLRSISTQECPVCSPHTTAMECKRRSGGFRQRLGYTRCG